MKSKIIFLCSTTRSVSICCYPPDINLSSLRPSFPSRRDQLSGTVLPPHQQQHSSSTTTATLNHSFTFLTTTRTTGNRSLLYYCSRSFETSGLRRISCSAAVQQLKSTSDDPHREDKDEPTPSPVSIRNHSRESPPIPTTLLF